MKILHIAQFGKRKTGIGTVVERLYIEQVRLGHEVRIATTSPNLAYKHLDIFNVSKAKYLYNLLDEFKPDAVLFHSVWIMPYIRMANILRKESIPYAIMMHGANSKENHKKNRLKKIFANLLLFNRFMRNAKTIIYLSQKEYENCVSRNVNPNYSIMPNGCDLVDVDIANKSIHTPVNIIFLGRLIIHHKGIDVLLDAINILYEQGRRDFHVSFYGNENDVDIETIKDKLHRIPEIASYNGPAYGDKKVEVFSNADAFILTSRYEGMPMGVLEALSYGVPCILTPGTNMADDVVEAGAGWETDFSSEGVASAILKSIKDLKDNYAKYHHSAYKMSKRYDWNVIANQSIYILSGICK